MWSCRVHRLKTRCSISTSSSTTATSVTRCRDSPGGLAITLMLYNMLFRTGYRSSSVGMTIAVMHYHLEISINWRARHDCFARMHLTVHARCHLPYNGERSRNIFEPAKSLPQHSTLRPFLSCTISASNGYMHQFCSSDVLCMVPFVGTHRSHMTGIALTRRECQLTPCSHR